MRVEIIGCTAASVPASSAVTPESAMMKPRHGADQPEHDKCGGDLPYHGDPAEEPRLERFGLELRADRCTGPGGGNVRRPALLQPIEGRARLEQTVSAKRETHRKDAEDDEDESGGVRLDQPGEPALRTGEPKQRRAHDIDDQKPVEEQITAQPVDSRVVAAARLARAHHARSLPWTVYRTPAPVNGSAPIRTHASIVTQFGVARSIINANLPSRKTSE